MCDDFTTGPEILTDLRRIVKAGERLRMHLLDVQRRAAGTAAHQGAHVVTLLFEDGRDLGLLVVGQLDGLVEALDHLRRIHHAATSALTATTAAARRRLISRRRSARRRTRFVFRAEE